MAKEITKDFAVIIHHNCLKDGIISVAVAFLQPYKKEMTTEIAKTLRKLLGEVKLTLFTMGKSNGLPFFLFIVTP